MKLSNLPQHVQDKLPHECPYCKATLTHEHIASFRDVILTRMPPIYVTDVEFQCPCGIAIINRYTDEARSN